MDKKTENALLAFIKAQFFKIARSAIIRWLISIGLKMTGPIGFVASFFVNKVLKVAWKYVVKLFFWGTEKAETKRELKEYDKKINDPKASADDVKQAGKDFLNS